MLFFSRLTCTDATPDTPPAAFSTRAEQAAQVMPVTSKVWVPFSAMSWPAYR